MGYRLSVRPRWLEIGQVLFSVCVLMERGGVEGRLTHEKKQQGQYPAILIEQGLSINN